MDFDFLNGTRWVVLLKKSPNTFYAHTNGPVLDYAEKILIEHFVKFPVSS